MAIPKNVIANADDLGLSDSVNRAILFCYKKGLINSSSLITNTCHCEDTAQLIHENPIINNIGVHVNLAEGKPVTGLLPYPFIDDFGNWNIKKTNQKVSFLKQNEKRAFAMEIHAQIEKALQFNVKIVHLDSHYHLHTLPGFYQLFLDAAQKYKLKLRLAQTYNEGNMLKYLYRKWVNNQVKINSSNYSDRFETVSEFLKTRNPATTNEIIEVMLHPTFGDSGELTDHYHEQSMTDWVNFVNG